MFDNNKQITFIESKTNDKYKEWFKLLKGRGIKKESRIIISGRKLIAEAVQFVPKRIKEYIFTQDQRINENLPEGISYFKITKEIFREIDINGTDYPLLVVDIPEINDFDENQIDDNIIVFIPFQDPSNVGTAIRSSAAFGVKTIVLLKEAANPYHPKSLRAAGTQIFMVKIMRSNSLKDLRLKKYPLAVLSMNGENLNKFIFPEKIAILSGLEGEGIPEDLKREYNIRIPIEKTVESLNAATALSIALYEWYGQKIKC